ncbi:cupin domain-containing protein [Clostridium oryzae]|uniref:Cupin domain protein n=1 Tax=Clostridium oryzae TaxID=1450648 RepID=A0A1V4IQH4_9CLOT|nr:cupin domain-containing protein [Clostridium oryzae]OPJ62153.1 cupin domain protein [Clostridium oryzae]
MKIEKLLDKIIYNDEKLTKKVFFNEDKVLNFVLNFKPGQGVPPHNHEQSDLIIHVLAGGGELVVDGNINNVAAGDVIYCKGTEVFSLQNTGSENMSCFVILAPNPSAIYSKEV